MSFLQNQVESQIKNSMVEAIEKYAKKYNISSISKLHIKMYLKEPEAQTQSPICYEIINAENNNVVLETPIIQEILGLKQKSNGTYKDLFHKADFCTSYIFAGILRYAEENQIAEENLSINIVHNGKQGKEAGLGFFLVKGTDYTPKANIPAQIIARITIKDFVGEKTQAKLEQIAKEAMQLMSENK